MPHKFRNTLTLNAFCGNGGSAASLVMQGRAIMELSPMANQQQQPQNEPRKAQPGRESPDRDREDMERPDGEEQRRREDDKKRPQ